MLQWSTSWTSFIHENQLSFFFWLVDVLRSQDKPNEFFFYELYENAAAIDHHKKQPHYLLWADFKESGGTVSSVSYKTDGEFLT